MSLGRRRRARPQLLAQVARTGPGAGARLADAPVAMQRRRRDLYREYVGDRAVSIFYCELWCNSPIIPSFVFFRPPPLTLLVYFLCTPMKFPDFDVLY